MSNKEDIIVSNKDTDSMPNGFKEVKEGEYMQKFKELSEEESKELDQRAFSFANTCKKWISEVKEADNLTKVQTLAAILLLTNKGMQTRYRWNSEHRIFDGMDKLLAEKDGIRQDYRTLLKRWQSVYHAKYMEYRDEATDELGTVHFRFADRLAKIGWYGRTVEVYMEYCDDGIIVEKREEVMPFVDRDLEYLSEMMEEAYEYRK